MAAAAAPQTPAAEVVDAEIVEPQTDPAGYPVDGPPVVTAAEAGF
jgi:hypothetical protein